MWFRDLEVSLGIGNVRSCFGAFGGVAWNMHLFNWNALLGMKGKKKKNRCKNGSLQSDLLHCVLKAIHCSVFACVVVQRKLQTSGFLGNFRSVFQAGSWPWHPRLQLLQLSWTTEKQVVFTKGDRHGNFRLCRVNVWGLWWCWTLEHPVRVQY